MAISGSLRLKGVTGLSGVVAMAAAVVLAAPQVSASEADFYRGKSISLLIGFHPGGGYDAYGRTVARHMGKHIPGNPGMIPRNFPGAGSLRLANHIYSRAKNDGTVMGIFASTSAFGPLFGEKKARFDTAKFTWIGNIDQSYGSCATWHTSGIKKFSDLMNTDSIFGATGPTSVSSQFPRGLNTLLGTRIKVIHGYPGSTGTLLAMKRGEVQAGCGFAISALKATRRQDWKSGKLVVLIQTGFTKHPDFGDVPHIYDLVKTKEDKQVIDLIFGRHLLGRPVAAPPKMSKVRATTLRTAFMATMKDPAFLKDTKRQHLPVQPFSGEQVDEAVAKFLSYPQKVVMRVRKAMELGKVIKVKLKKVSGTITKVSKKRIKVKGADGKSHTFKVSGRRSKIKIGGKKAKKKALKAGMNCSFRYYGEGDLAKNISCK